LAQGKVFLFTSNPTLMNQTSYTFREYQYLQSTGYQVQQDREGFYRATKK
jgi:hypothetical protein